MVTRAELKAQREAGPTQDEINVNRRILLEEAATAAVSALDEAATAIAAVEAAADLAEAQAAVSGVGATVSSARDGLDQELV